MAVNYLKVGTRIQNARNLRKMTIGELADKVHFTPKSIALVEAGKAEVNLSLFCSICTALDIAPNELLEGEYQVSGNTRSLEEEQMLDEMRELLAEMRGDSGDGSTVIRDSESVIREIRDMLKEEKAAKAESGSNVSLSARKPAEKKKANGRAHYF